MGKKRVTYLIFLLELFFGFSVRISERNWLCNGTWHTSYRWGCVSVITLILPCLHSCQLRGIKLLIMHHLLALICVKRDKLTFVGPSAVACQGLQKNNVAMEVLKNIILTMSYDSIHLPFPEIFWICVAWTEEE